jgi:hypothetical protein
MIELRVPFQFWVLMKRVSEFEDGGYDCGREVLEKPSWFAGFLPS